MQELTIWEHNTTIEETLENNTKRIFNFVKKHKQVIVDINKHKFLGEYKRKELLGDPAVFLYRVLDETDYLVSTPLFASYRIVKVNKNSYKVL